MQPDLISQLQARIRAQPKDPSLYYDLGRCYLAAQAAVKATEAFHAALKLAPNHPQVLMQLGNAASLAGREAEACQYFEASLAVDPQQADVHFNLANSLRKRQLLHAAIAHYQTAIRMQPNDADFYNNCGNAYRELGALDLAIQAYSQALRIAPTHIHTLVHWIHQKQHTADWQGLPEAIARVRQALTQTQSVQIPPFAFLAMPGTTDAEHTQCASAWAQATFRPMTLLPAPTPKSPHGTIKVAYLSSDFRQHPLASLVTDVLQLHDRRQFEVVLLSQALPDDSREQAAFRAAADHWIDIHTRTDHEVAHQLRQLDIDLLVDLTGYTQNSRTGIVAYRPARVHVNWLGFPGSMGYLHGKPLFDAIIVDDTLNLPNLAERPVVLPCYQPNNALHPLADAGTRASHGLPDNAFVFFCFNQSFKITDTVFAHWMHILKQVPNSVLWLLASNRWAVQGLQAAAAAAGIAADRLIFAKRTDLSQHLARQQHADLMLDTLPYNAHTTASDALRAGVPIVTVVGDTFASRVSASLLRHIGLPQLVCDDWDTYCQTAIRLATDQATLNALKAQLRQQAQRLFDPQQFVSALERAYRTLLER